MSALMVLALAGCSSAPQRDEARGSVDLNRLIAESDAIPFARVDLERFFPPGTDYVPGEAVRTVALTQTDLASAWPKIAKGINLPPLEMGDSALILVASEQFPDGPARIEVEEVRQRRADGKIWVLLRLHTQRALNNYPARSIRGVFVGRSHIGDRQVAFVDLSPDVLP